MQEEMKRKLCLTKQRFEFGNGFSGYANITFNLLYRKIILTNPQGVNVIVAKQVGFWKKISSIISIIRPRSSLFIKEICPFICKNQKGEEIGRINYLGGYSFEMILYDIIYRIQLHKGNKVSIYKGNMEIATITKDNIHTFYKSRYSISCYEQDIRPIFLGAIFADIIMFALNGMIFLFGEKTVLVDRRKNKHTFIV